MKTNAWSRLDWLVLAVFAGLVVLFYWRILTPNPADRQSFPPGDFHAQFWAFATLEVGELSAGRLPLWNPYTFAGAPFWADVQSAVLYPPSLLTILFSAPWGFSLFALEIEAIAHFWLAAVFMVLFVRTLTRSRPAAFIAALTFTFSGYLTGYPSQQLAVLEADVWLPLILFFLYQGVERRGAAVQGRGGAEAREAKARHAPVSFDKSSNAPTLQPSDRPTLRLRSGQAFQPFGFAQDRPSNPSASLRTGLPTFYFLLAGVAWGMTLLAGHPQSALMVAYVSTAYFFFLWLMGSREQGSEWRGVSNPLRSPQYILRAMFHASRYYLLFLFTGLGLAAIQFIPAVEYTLLSVRAEGTYDKMSGGFPITDLIQLLLPGQVSLYSPLYIGIVGLILALWVIFASPTHHTTFWAITGGLALLISFGGNTFFYSPLYLSIPGFTIFRGQERWAFLVVFSLAVLVGYGFSAVMQDRKGADERRSRGAGEQGSRGAGEQGSKGAGEQGRRGAEEQGESEPSSVLRDQQREVGHKEQQAEDHRSSVPDPHASKLPTFRLSNLSTFQSSNPPILQSSNPPTLQPSNLPTFQPSNLPLSNLQSITTTLLLFALLLDFIFFYGLNDTGWSPESPFYNLLAGSTLLTLLLTLAWLLWKFAPRLRPGLGTALTAAIICVDLFTINWTTNLYPQPPEWHTQTPGVVQAIKADAGQTSGEPYRVYNEFRLFDNYGVPYEIEDLWGASPLRPARYDQFLARPMPIERAWELLNVKYVITWREELYLPSTIIYPEPAADGTTYVHRLDAAGPRAWLVTQAEIADDATILERLADPSFDRWQIALLEADDQSSVIKDQLSVNSNLPTLRLRSGQAFQPSTPPLLHSSTPQSLFLSVTSPTPALLILSEPYYPGWQATIDGAPAPIVRANYVLRAIPVPAGEHRVELKFFPLTFSIGAIISAISLIAVTITLLLIQRRRGVR